MASQKWTLQCCRWRRSKSRHDQQLRSRIVFASCRPTLTLHVMIIPGVGQMCRIFLTPPGSAETEIEQFWCMEIWSLHKIWFSGRKPRSLNIFSNSRIWDFDGISPPRVCRPDKTNPSAGADFSISPSRFDCDMQSVHFQFVFERCASVLFTTRRQF